MKLFTWNNDQKDAWESRIKGSDNSETVKAAFVWQKYLELITGKTKTKRGYLRKHYS